MDYSWIILGLLSACTSSNLQRGTASNINEVTQSIIAGTNGKKIALLIGDKDYEHIGSLNKTINDATDISHALAELGFEVILETDISKQAFKVTLNKFSERSKGANVAMLFYAGYDLQVNGENILIPIDYDPSDQQSGFSANPIQKIMQDSTHGTKMLVLDACRNNPFLEAENNQNRRSVNNKSGVAKGLASMAKTDEFYIGYSTAAGEIASEGTG